MSISKIETAHCWGCAYPADNVPSTGKTLGFVLLIILGLACFAVLWAGLNGYFSHFSQINSNFLITTGGGGGIVLMVLGIVGLAQETCRKAICCQCGKPDETIQPPTTATTTAPISGSNLPELSKQSSPVEGQKDQIRSIPQEKQDKIIKRCKEEILIEQIVVARGDYWVEEEDGVKILFFRGKDNAFEIQTLSDSDHLPTVCQRDTKKEFECLKKCGRLPKALGAYLANHTASVNVRLKTIEQCMLPNEYWCVNPSFPDSLELSKKARERQKWGQYDKPYITIIKNHEGKTERYFFINRVAQKQFLKQGKGQIKNGFTRHNRV